MNRELLYPSRETIRKLTKDLKLKGATQYTQDWECEVADVNQLSKYIDYYKKKQLTLNEKTTLMRIILESYNDYIGMNHQEDRYGEGIKAILENDYIIHEETIKFWSCENEDLEDCYAITLFIRSIKGSKGDTGDI